MKQINQLPYNEFKLIVDNTESLYYKAWNYGQELMNESIADIMRYFKGSVAEYNIGYPADYINLKTGEEIQFLKDLAEADFMEDFLGMEDGLLIERLLDREESFNTWNYYGMSDANSERFENWFFSHVEELKDKLLETLKGIRDHFEESYLECAYEDGLFPDDMFIGNDGRVYRAAFIEA